MLKNSAKQIFLFLILIFSCSSLFALGKKNIGTTGANFLKLGVNARAISMGEAYTAVSDGSDAIYWNPAGLDYVKGQSFSFMHAVYLSNIFYDFTSYAKRIGNAGTMGFGMQYLSSGNIDETDEFGSNVGTLKPYNLALSAGWAMKINQFLDSDEEGDLSVGIVGKFIQSKIIETAVAGAADFGINWSPVEKYTFSLVAQNIGPSFKFKEELDHLPLNFKLGSSYKISKPFLIALDANFPRDNDPYGAFGFEYKQSIIKDLSFNMRSGYNSRTVSGINGLTSISSGVGFGWKNYELDFAWVPFGELGHTYRVSLAAKF